MRRTHETALGLCLLLAMATGGIAQVAQVRGVLVRETLPGIGRLPTIAVDDLNRPHIMADGGASRGGVNIFDRIGSGASPWRDYSFDSTAVFGTTQFYNPHLEITPDGKAFCGAIVFGRLIGMGTILRTGMNGNSPSSPIDGYSVRLLQRSWDAGETSVDFTQFDQFVISSSFGLGRIYAYDPSAYGDIREIAARDMFAGNGGEKNAFWISKAGAVRHPTSGTHAVWHGAIGGYNRWDSSYQNSMRHERGLPPLAFAAYWRYRIMEDDGTYVDVKSDNIEHERAYITCGFVNGQGGVCVNIYNPSTGAMLFPTGDLLTIDAGGWSGLRRYAPQLAPAKDGGAWITWTSRGGVYVRFISPTGRLGNEFRVGDGERSNLCVDPEGYVHVVFSNGNLRYCKLDVTGAGGGYSVLEPQDFDGDGIDDPATYHTGSGTFFVLGSTDGEFEVQWGVQGDIPVPGDYDAAVPLKANFAIYRPSEGKWHIRPDAGGAAVVRTLGKESDTPVPGDYDGDGKIDPMVVDTDTYTWSVLRSASGYASLSIQHGTEKDHLLIGDFNKDGSDEICVYRPSNYTWYWKTLAGVSGQQAWGWTGDIPTPADFDGDTFTDIAVFRPSESKWYINPSKGGARIEYAWGKSTQDIPVPGRYDRDANADVAYYDATESRWFIRQSTDGKTMASAPVHFGWAQALDRPLPAPYSVTGQVNVAVYRPITSEWFLRGMNDGDATVTTRWGNVGDWPILGDFNGDGLNDLCTVRESDYVWRVRIPGNNNNITQQFGWRGDIPVPGDYNGDRTTDIAVYRPSDGVREAMWFVHGSAPVRWGWINDRPVPADYDGDRKTDIGVFRPSDGRTSAAWFVRLSNGGKIEQPWGWIGDVPVPADYNGDGIADIAIYRPSTAEWFILMSDLAQTRTVWAFGVLNGTPCPADYDGDKIADAAAYKDGMWYVRQSSDGKLMKGRGSIIFGDPSEEVIGTRAMPTY